MTPALVLETVIRPTLAWMGSRYASPEAEVLLLSIQQQEDAACARCQEGGPARGLWQFEPGGVAGVLGHERTGDVADSLACQLGYVSRVLAGEHDGLCEAMQTDDRLACVFARLLLWTLPAPLPAIGQGGEAWSQYVKLWRPGKPRPLDWAENYRAALAAVTDAGGGAPGAAA